jgi:small conductance mechanosensitive channel
MGWTNLLISALTAAGVFTIIIGFAVKDVAANFISGIFILIDQPFAPGDFIQVSDFSGTVKNVSLRTTILVTLDGPLVYIPNSVVAVEPMTNYSLAQDRRVNFIVSIANDAEVGQALKIINRVLEEEPRLLPERPQVVLVSDVREYAIDISVTAYTSSDALLAVTSELQQQVLAALHANQIELAVPVRKNVYPDLPAVMLQTEDLEQPIARGES